MVVVEWFDLPKVPCAGARMITIVDHGTSMESLPPASILVVQVHPDQTRSACLNHRLQGLSSAVSL